MSTAPVTRGDTASEMPRCNIAAMDKPLFKPTYLRQWREHRGLSLRRLAERMETEPGVELISHASLGRIEKGQQPYSQPIIEAAAVALNVSVPMLLEMDPTKEGEVVDLVRQMDERKREQAIALLKALAQTG